jgi:hypothetical protein
LWPLAPLLGSYINIPIAALGQDTMVTEREVTYFSMRYIVPVIVDSPGVVLAVNVEGAVIPTLLSIYLLSKNRLWERGRGSPGGGPRGEEFAISHHGDPSDPRRDGCHRAVA